MNYILYRVKKMYFQTSKKISGKLIKGKEKNYPFDLIAIVTKENGGKGLQIRGI